MKALSIFQPWAAAICLGEKKIETRSWSTRHHGPLLIHAARTHVGLDIMRANADFWRAVLKIPAEQSVDAAFRSLPFGALVAQCDLVACVSTSRTAEIREAARATGERYGPSERELGDYSRGRFAWLLKNVRPLPAPIAARGRQALFDVDDALLCVGARGAGATP